jgi:hypothetical protein
MSLARLREVTQLLPPGHPAGVWFRAGVAFYLTGRRFGITLDAALQLDDPGPALTPRKAACYRRATIIREIAVEFFPGLRDIDQAKRIGIEIARYCRAEWPDDRNRGAPARRRPPLRCKLFELLALGLSVREKTILRAIRNT